MSDVDIWLHDFFDVPSIQIQEAGDIRIERVLQGSEQLSFNLELDDPKLPFTHEDQLVLAFERYWRVDHFEDNHPGRRRAVCNARWIELSWRTLFGVFPILGKTPLQGLTAILAGSGWTVGSVPADSALFTTEAIDFTVLAHIRQWSTITGYEVEFNTIAKTVSFFAAVGTARQVGFRWGHSIRSIKRTFHPPPATRLYPVGANSLTIASVNVTGLDYIEDYSFYEAQGLTTAQARASYRKDLMWVDDRYQLALNLYDAAVTRLTALAQPRVFYEANVIDLSRIMGSSFGFMPGDTMPVDDEILGILEIVRVTRVIQYPMDPKKDAVELGFLSTGLLDVNSGTERSIKYDTLTPVVDENDLVLTVSSGVIHYNEVSVTSAGVALAITGSTFVGTSTGAGTIRFSLDIDGTTVGGTYDVVFTTAQRVEFSWPSFASDLVEGAHDIRWRAQVVSGVGTISVALKEAKSWVLLRGAVGVGTGSSPSQFIVEILALIPALTMTESVVVDLITTNDVTETDSLAITTLTLSDSTTPPVVLIPF